MYRTNTKVEPLISHTPWWMARAMGYEGSWVLKGQFGCKSQFGDSPDLWGVGGGGGMTYGRYGFKCE